MRQTTTEGVSLKHGSGLTRAHRVAPFRTSTNSGDEVHQGLTPHAVASYGRVQTGQGSTALHQQPIRKTGTRTDQTATAHNHRHPDGARLV